MKRLFALAVLVGSLVIGVSSVGASGTFSARLYRGHSSCSTGATDTAGAKYGTFTVTTHSGSQIVDASITTDNLAAFRTYNVSIYEWGHSCTLNQNVTSFTTDGGGHAIVHFQFWAHSGEHLAWAWIQHGATTDIVKSTTVPINN
jgi:hypothetical protein